MTSTDDFLKANESYAASFGDKGSLAIPPARKLVIITCMDARIDPAAHLGLKEGDAHVIRNAGGVAADAIRSIVISQRLLETHEIAVFHHTGCGMLLFQTQQLRDLVKNAAPDDSEVARHVDAIHFHEFSNLEEAVQRDVLFLKSHPLVLKETTITGWIYEVETGRIRQII
ncbi:carbonic anhydrase [Multifurca ochricompacta]|uniref:Carbonic anhydrase n=1 Tax=Multifurca ochricompacta TaxID=376703 RepID=A0AAD4M553_9AGAM|nr:carbonic anhydrase [Multifurca ochricompacta]KAI0300974.1 carbonic anhydrase [Multifurca ochricompacta]